MEQNAPASIIQPGDSSMGDLLPTVEPLRSKEDALSTAPPLGNASYAEQMPGDNIASSAPADPCAVRPHLGEIVPTAGPGGDATAERKPAEAQRSVDGIITDMTTGLKMECMQWTQVFMESEQFEICSSTHAEKLLEDARALEQDLLQQKERLLSHLKLLSQTLKLT